MVELQSASPRSLPDAVRRISVLTLSTNTEACLAMFRIVATILAPTPYVAAIFIIFAKITKQLGVQYSRLSPRWCESQYCDPAGRLATDQRTVPTDSRIFLTAVSFSSALYHHSLALIADSQDIVALVIQAAGGGLAATASTQSGSNLVRV